MADWTLKEFTLTNSGVTTKTYRDENNIQHTKKYLLNGHFSFTLHYSRGTNILKKTEIYYRYKNNPSDTNIYEKLLGTTEDKIGGANQGAALDTEDNWALAYNSSDIFDDFKYQSNKNMVLVGFRVKCYDRELFGGSSLRLNEYFDFTNENDYIYPIDYLRNVKSYAIYAYEYDVNEKSFRFHPNIRFTAAVDVERGLSLQKALITIEDPDDGKVFFQTMPNFSLNAYQQYTINDLNLETVLQEYEKEAIKVRVRYLCQGQYNENGPIGNYRLSGYHSSIFTWKKRKTFKITINSQEGGLWANLDKEDSLVLNWEEEGEKYEDGIYKLKISNSAWQSVFSFSLLKDSSKTFQLTNDIFKTNLKTTIEGKPISELYGQINNQFYDNYTIELSYLDKWDQRDLNHYSATGSLDVTIEDSNISFLGNFYYDDITSYTITTTSTISKNFQNSNYAVCDDVLTITTPQIVYWSRALLNDPDFSNLNIETKYYNGTASFETLPLKIQNWVQSYNTNNSYKINIKIQPLLDFGNDIIYGNITNGPIINLSAKRGLNCDIYTGTNEIYYIVKDFGTDKTLEALLRDNTAYLKITFSDDSSTPIIYSQLLSNITEERRFIINYDALGLQSNKDYMVIFEIYLFDGADYYTRKQISQWSYNFDRPTFSPRKNGFIINGIPGAQLKKNNFIEINALDASKGISIIYFGETDVPVEGKIYYKPSDGKIHLSGFVIDEI